MYQERLKRLRERMAATGTDLVAAGPTSNMVYLAGLSPHGDERPVMLIVTKSHAGVLMPALNVDSSRKVTDLPFYAWSDAEGPQAALKKLLADSGPVQSRRCAPISRSCCSTACRRARNAVSSTIPSAG